MTISGIIFVALFGLLPSIFIAFGVTLFNLDKKNKLGDLSDVEYSKHFLRVNKQYECSIKDLKKKN